MNIIVIVGLSATGKSTLALELASKLPDCNLYHTDEYTEKYGSPNDLYKLRELLKIEEHENVIIEGVLGFRLLRKGLELKDFSPDKVILCHCKPEVRIKRYEERGKEVPYTQDKGLLTIYRDYEQLLAKIKNKPKFETYAS